MVLSGTEDRLNIVRDEFEIVRRNKKRRAIGILVNFFPSFALHRSLSKTASW